MNVFPGFTTLDAWASFATSDSSSLLSHDFLPLYIDSTLPFGQRSAPKIFTALVDAAEWIIKQAGVDFVIHYLDDFLVIGAPGTS